MAHTAAAIREALVHYMWHQDLTIHRLLVRVRLFRAQELHRLAQLQHLRHLDEVVVRVGLMALVCALIMMLSSKTLRFVLTRVELG